MFKTEKKEVKEFKKLIKEANSLVKKNNFESALSLYSKIIKYKDVDESLKKDLSKLQDSLILYLKMNEAYVLAKDANFKMLKKVLDSVAELKARIKEESPEMKNMVNYIADHHNFVTNYYDSYFHRKKFNQNLKTLYKLLNKRDTENAVVHYQELLKSYKILSLRENYEQRLKLYNQVKNAYTDLHLVGVNRKL